MHKQYPLTWKDLRVGEEEDLNFILKQMYRMYLLYALIKKLHNALHHIGAPSNYIRNKRN